MNDRKKYLLTSTFAVGVAALGAVAFAPSAALAQSQSQEEENERATQVEEVVVVGSRIRRDNYNSPSPVQVVTREETTLAGFNSTTEVLQSTSVTGGTGQINNAYGGFVTNGGPGANTLSLRGLGAERTLILLNGRRVAPAGSRGSVGSADLNVLPTAMIERIEVLKDGASSIYGSDAVAGVVNIITRNDVEGITIEGQYNGTTDADGEGNQSRVSIVGGLTGDRWQLSASLERYSREEMTLGARGWAQCARENYVDGSDFIDPMTGQSKCYTVDGGGVTINTIGTSAITGDAFVNAVGGVPFLNGVIVGPGVPAGQIANGAYFNRWRPNSSVSTGLIGFEGVGGAYLNSRTNPTGFLAMGTGHRDSFEEDMLKESLVSPVDVSTFYVQGSYDTGVLGNAEVYGEFLANRRESTQVGYRQLALDYFRGSPLIPTQLQFSNFSANQGLSPTTGPNANARVGVRAFVGWGLYDSEQTVDFTKFVGGIRGDLFVNDWRYDLSFSTSRSSAEYMFEQFITNLLQDSLDVVAAPAGTDTRLVRGGYTCRVNVTDPGRQCIPAPFLNTDTIAGNMPQDWANYVFRPVTGTTQYDETVVSLGLDGPLFTLPAGEVSAFFGVEWREASIDDTPGLDMQNGNIYGFSTAGITRGSDSVWEAFGELEIPLLANVPGAQELTFNGSFRYTDYESYGDDTTYKVGLVWTPVSFLSFRGTYGTSYRAPALFEQFVGGTSGFISNTNDPCHEYGTDPNPAVVANCATENLPGAGNFNQTSSVRVITSGGAEAGLSAETSENKTFGVIFQPDFLPSSFGDLSFAVDYYEIQVDNGVSRIGAANVMNFCYSSSTSDFQSRAGYCQLVVRDPTTFTLTAYDSYVNVATDVVKGLDYTLRYSRDIGPGTALLNIGVTQMTERYSTLFADDPIYDEVGTIGTPEFSGTIDATYRWNEWRFRYGVEWVAATGYEAYYQNRYGASLINDYGINNEVDDYYLHSASVQYNGDNWAVTAGVRNLFNEDPDYISTGYATRIGNVPLYSGYDYFGRMVFVNLSKSF